jgi:hypothetical protein
VDPRRVDGMMNDAPMPMSARAPMSIVDVDANADRPDPTPKIDSPTARKR